MIAAGNLFSKLMQHWKPSDLQKHFQNPQKLLQILDVRESWEYDIAHFEQSTLIPLGQLPYKLEQLDKGCEWLVICHHGIRSAQACYYLEHNGFSVINLTGGIDRWSRDIDLDMPLY